jgi:hypothetical protein
MTATVELIALLVAAAASGGLVVDPSAATLIRASTAFSALFQADDEPDDEIARIRVFPCGTPA